MIRIAAALSGGGKSRILTAMVKDSDTRLAQGVDRAAIRLQNEIKINLAKGGAAGATRSAKIRGRVRIYPRNETNHLRSITGKLLGSWKTRRAARAGAYIEGHVFTNNPYSAIHEFGGPSGSARGRFIMRARPYVAPAMKTTRPQMVADMVSVYVRPIK